MSLKQLMQDLETFDRSRGWDHYARAESRDEKIAALSLETINMLGEFGEFANILKKCRRDGTWRVDELQEEVADTFIFLLKISRTLDMDLEAVFREKMAANEKRFPAKV